MAVYPLSIVIILRGEQISQGPHALGDSGFHRRSTTNAGVNPAGSEDLASNCNLARHPFQQHS